jgi:hypothetical protein
MESQATIDVFAEASLPFEGRWNRLISTTNWEKGEIIFEWRSALKSNDAPTTDYSDEAWARRVGGVTGQHIGRLRRVYERFGETREQFDGLFWSHFQAAIDWDDAEMWLEGAIQNNWSVSNMRKSRWEAYGAPAELKPKDEDIIVAELNEDLDAREDHAPTGGESNFDGESRSPGGPDFGDEDELPVGNAEAPIASEDAAIVPFVRPFENLNELPDDVAEAFDAFKLAIIRRKNDGWEDFPREDMLGTLEALKELTMAPAVGDE